MNRGFFIVIALLLMQSQAVSQSQPQKLQKFEVAGEFTTLEREDIFGLKTDPGFGGRFTYNINKVVSLEAAGYFFPQRCFFCRNAGRVTEGLGGVKVGKRFEKWGIFAKGRPGVISFGEGTSNGFTNLVGPGPFPIQFEIKRLTTFAADVGGVVEFYPSKRIVTRFDVGDTIIHFGPRTFDTVLFNPVDNSVTNAQFTIGSRTTHKLQFMTSVGFRF